MAKHQQFHLAGWPAFLLAPLVIPIILVVLLLQKLSVLKRTADLTPRDVANYIEDSLSDRSGDWDWDDFTSIPITDPSLEAIRIEAADMPLPLQDDDCRRLQEMVKELRP